MKKLSLLFLLVLFQTSFFSPRILWSQNERRTGVSQSDVQVLQNITKSLYGSNQSVTGVINIDRAIGNLFVLNGRITNPYGRLSGCYLYCALGRKINFKEHNGFIGVYKNDTDFWHSDTIINNNNIYEGGFFTTRDLNKDGTVEIITTWSPGEDNSPQYMWIFSWDGQIGECINAVDENGQSVIWSDYFEGFEFPDVNGDGILEIQGWRDQGEGDPVTYSWNGQLYGNWPNTPQPPKGFILPRNRVDEDLRAKVEKTIDGYKYQYTVKIESTSIQDVNQILLECEINSVQKVVSRKGWIFKLWEDLLGWTNASHPPTENLLLAGQIDSSFVYVSSGLPKILYYYVRGYNSDQVSFKNLKENSASGLTIGAANPPDPFSAAGFADSLIQYCVKSDSLNWITDSASTAKYSGYFENAKSHIQQNNKPAAINVLDSVLTNVEADGGVTLTSEAYALIKYNTEYLRDHLERE
jgi:hypothetical protein